jgi:hypothetical protein
MILYSDVIVSEHGFSAMVDIKALMKAPRLAGGTMFGGRGDESRAMHAGIY